MADIQLPPGAVLKQKKPAPAPKITLPPGATLKSQAGAPKVAPVSPVVEQPAAVAPQPINPRPIGRAAAPTDHAARIKQKYKAIAPYDLAVVDSRPKGISDGRKLEFYPPEEINNPNPGKLTVEVFDPAFKDGDFDRMVAADFLHYLGKKDPKLIELRQQFARSITPEQRQIDQRAYERARAGEWGPPEQRPYDEWYEVHRLDQYLGAMMLPENSPERQDWMQGMTPAQQRILADIDRYLRTGGQPPLPVNPRARLKQPPDIDVRGPAMGKLVHQDPPLSIGEAAEAMGKGVPRGGADITGDALKALQIADAGTIRRFIPRLDRYLAGDLQPIEPYAAEISTEDAEDDRAYKILSKMHPEQVADLRGKLMGRLNIEQGALHQTGAALQESAREAFPLTRSQEESTAYQIGAGAGSTVPLIAAAMIPGVGPLTATAGGMLAMGTQGFEDARRNGADLDTAYLAFSRNALVGATEILPIAHLLSRLDKATGGRIRGAVMQGTIQAFEEGGQEGVQQFLANVIAKDLYDPERTLMQDVLQSMGIGSVVGGGIGAAGGAVAPQRQPNRRDLERFLDEPERKEPTLGPILKPAQPPQTPQPVQEPEIAGVTSATPGDGTAAAPRVVTTAEDLTEASSQAATSPLNARPEPTQAQKEAGNYPKAHVKVQGLDISIENPKGSTRSGTGPEGDWSVTMPAHYGYIRRSEGADGDQVDVFIGDQVDAPEAYVIDQLDPTTGEFDEAKIVMGVPDMVSAIQTYDESFSGGGQDRIGSVTPLSIDELKAWIKSGDTKKPLGNIAAAQKVIRDRLAEQQALAAQPEAAPAVPNQTQPAPSTEPVTVQPAQPMPGVKLPKGAKLKPSRGRKQPFVSITAIARKWGGIVDYGGELRAMDMHRKRPGSVRIPRDQSTRDAFGARRGGGGVDAFGEHLFQTAEYRDLIRSDNDPDTWDTNKVLELLRQDLAGRPPVPRGSEADQIEEQEARQEEAFREKAWQDANARTQELLGRDLDQKEFEAILARHVAEGYDRIEDAVTDELESDVILDAEAEWSKRSGQENVQARSEEAGRGDREEPPAEPGPEGAPAGAQADEARERGPDQDQGSPRARGPQTELTDQGEQTVMPGMERSAKQAAQARDEKRGGRMGTDKAQQEPGGMFDLPDGSQIDIEGFSNTTEDSDGRTPVDVTIAAGLRISGDVQQANASAAEWVVRRGTATGHEYAAVLGADGTLLSASTLRDPKRAAMTQKATEMAADTANSLMIHHNHPIAVALSNTDIYNLARPGIGFVIANNHDGTFSAARIAPAAWDQVMIAPEGANLLLREVYDDTWAALQVIKDTDERQDAAMRVLAAVGLLDYHTSLKPRHSFTRIVDVAAHTIRKRLSDAGWRFAAGPSGVLHRPTVYDDAAAGLAAISRLNAEAAAGKRRVPRADGVVSGSGELEGRRREGAGARARQADSADSNSAPSAPSLPQEVGFENRTFGNPNAPNVATRAAGQQIQIDILKHLNRPGWRAGAERRLRSWRTIWRDRFATMADVEKYIEGKTGQRTPAAKSFYKSEEVFTGKVADQLQQFHEGMLKELYDAMHDSGLSVKEIEKYLVAKHAPERNATIAAINPKLPDGGSGMTNAQAQAVIDGFRTRGKLGVLQRVSDAVKRIRRFDLDTRIRAGLIPARDVANKLRDWPNYVPLKGFEELFTDDELVGRPRPRLGSGFSVKNREYFSAMGRESEATNILANLISQAEESIVRAEKTKVAQVLADFVTANPDDSFWKVDLVTTKRVINPDTGLVEVQYTRMPSLEDEEQFVIYFKKDGELHRIWIANPRLVANIRNMSANELPKWTKALQLFATIFRAVNVNANPEFVIPNAVRDLQTGLVQSLQHKAPGLKRKMVKYWPQAAKASWAGYGGKGGPAGSWKGWYRRMARAGGKVDFFNIDDIESQVSNIEGEMRRRTKKPLAIGENILRGAYKLLDRANHSVENAVRLAAFRACVEAGFTDAEAASVSKNITVNFNRRGEVSRWANLLWPFFNAAVQGTFTLGTAAARSGKVRAALAGLTLMGFAEGIVNGLLSAGGDDDEDESDFDKIPEYIRRKNIIIMNPGYPKNGGPPYWTLPIGYGLNVFWNAGREMSDIALGKKTIGEALGNVGVSAADAFIPIDIDSLTGLLPAFAQAPGEVLANRSFADKPIYREPTEPEKKANLPDSSITRPGTNEVWKAIADGLNKMSGGSDYEPGLFDFHPESMEHIFKTYAGGVGSIISRTADLLSPEPGDSFELGKVPVIRKVIGYFPRSTESNRYYESRGEIEEAAGRLKAAEEAGDDEAAERFATEGERQLGLESELKASEKRLRQLRKEAREVRAEPGMPPEERKAALQAIYEEMDAETSGFNKTFYREIERPRQLERSPVIRPLFEKKRKDVRATLEGEF